MKKRMLKISLAVLIVGGLGFAFSNKLLKIANSKNQITKKDFSSEAPSYEQSSTENSFKNLDRDDITLNPKLKEKPAFKFKPTADPTVWEKSFAKAYRSISPIEINLDAWLGAYKEKKQIQIQAANQENIRIELASVKKFDQAYVLQGYILDGSPIARSPAFTMTVSGNYVEGFIPTKSGGLRIVSGPSGSYLVQ